MLHNIQIHSTDINLLTIKVNILYGRISNYYLSTSWPSHSLSPYRRPCVSARPGDHNRRGSQRGGQNQLRNRGQPAGPGVSLEVQQHVGVHWDWAASLHSGGWSQYNHLYSILTEGLWHLAVLGQELLGNTETPLCVPCDTGRWVCLFY